MGIKEDFGKAQEDIRSLTSLDNQNLLKLYGLYKQASVGDVSGKKPGTFDLKGKAKYSAWEEEKGKSAEEAMKEYIALVQELLS